jgi:PEP-CTERM/exosortase A-associated glycosyltransferase
MNAALPRNGASLRVLHVLDHSLPVQTGYSYRTLAILRAQRSLGWETVHLTSPKQGTSSNQEETIDGWHFHRTPVDRTWPDLPGWRDLQAAWATARRLAEIVARTRPSFLHAHSPLLNGYPALWVGRRFGIPVVYEVRAFWEDAAADHGTAREWGMRYRATRALETRLLRRADGIVAICDGLRREILGRGGIAAERVVVAPNVIDAAAFGGERRIDTALRERLGLSGATTVLGFIGSFYHYEGLELLVRALAPMLREDPAIRLLLVGGGPVEPQLRQVVREERLEDRIVIPGRVAHGEVGAYYDLVDVFLYPRLPMRLTDLVTPLKPLEAMAAGRIVVASDVGGHRELVEDGVNGFLFKAGDAASLRSTLARTLARRSGWTLVAGRARVFVSTQRSVERMAESYAGIALRLGSSSSHANLLSGMPNEAGA